MLINSFGKSFSKNFNLDVCVALSLSERFFPFFHVSI